MQSAKLFTNGRSQAVRLPKECRFEGSEVYVKRYDSMVILLPKGDPWATLVDSLEQFSADFMSDREQPSQEDRLSLE